MKERSAALAKSTDFWADELDLASLPFLNASSQSLCMPDRSLKEITMGYWPIGPLTSLEPRISK